LRELQLRVVPLGLRKWGNADDKDDCRVRRRLDWDIVRERNSNRAFGNTVNRRMFLLPVVGGLILLSPIAFLRQREISRRPIVTASASGQHVIPAKGKSGPHVLALVEFDRPSKDGQTVHCKIADQFVGWPSDPQAFDISIRLAVRTDSCYDSVRVP
jgi:hypothetical protein